MTKFVVYITYVRPLGDKKQVHWTAYGHCYQDAIASVKAALPDHIRENMVSIDVREFGKSEPLIGSSLDRNTW